MTKRLYKYDSGGKLRVWFMTLKGSSYTTTAGLADGALVTSAPTRCVGKQRRTDEEQAAFEVESGYTYNLAREYFLTPEEAAGDARFFKPMLAHKWGDVGWAKAQALLAKKYAGAQKMVGTGVYHNVKYDGFRCIAQASGLTSREGQPIVSAPHIMSALEQFFAQFPDAVLDGELYTHDLRDDFGTLSSVLKKQKPTADDLAKSASLAQLHVYDYPSPDVAGLPYSERARLLMLDLGEFASDVIQIVEPTMARDPEHLEELRLQALEDGYEGQIVRLDLSYEQKRSQSVLKNKTWLDDEFEVVGIHEGIGNWAGVAKRIVCRLPDGREFGAGIRGNKHRASELLGETWERATVRYFALSPDGVPRFPVAVSFFNGERL